MSAITGIGESTTIVLSASTSLSRGTATRTTSAPASATWRICSMVAPRFAVSVFVIVCTTTGAPPPICTPPTLTDRSEAMGTSLGGLDSAPVSLKGRVFGALPPTVRDRIASPPPRELRTAAGDRLLVAPAFVLSSVRSGSTLLRVLLATHSQIHAPHELH